MFALDKLEDHSGASVKEHRRGMENIRKRSPEQKKQGQQAFAIADDEGFCSKNGMIEWNNVKEIDRESDRLADS